jgi:predicted small lipoprotein YifL
MKKVLAVAALVLIAACGEKKAVTPAADTTSMKMDSTMPMKHDSGMQMKMDSTMARDTAKKM